MADTEGGVCPAYDELLNWLYRQELAYAAKAVRLRRKNQEESDRAKLISGVLGRVIDKAHKLTPPPVMQDRSTKWNFLKLLVAKCVGFGEKRT